MSTSQPLLNKVKSKVRQHTIDRVRFWLHRHNPPAYGPTGLAKTWMGYRDYCDRFDGTWHPAYPPLTCRWPKPGTRSWGSIRANFTSRLRSQIPETGVLEIPQGQVMDIQGYTLTRDDVFLPDLSYHRGQIEHAHLPHEKYPIEPVAGRCLSLMTNASNNYCHFLLDALPRLHLVEKAGLSLADMDWFYVPKPMSTNAWRIFRQLGLDETKCIWAERQKGIQADRLFATTHPSLQMHYPRWVVDFMQRKIPLKPCQPHRRLYVPRNVGSRKVANEPDLYPILQRHGFELYLPDKSDDQAQIFHEAAIVIAPHGAALANLVFCQPGSIVLELMSVEHIKPYFYALAQVAGLNHGYIVGPTTQRRTQFTGICHLDFTIKPAHLEAALHDISHL